MLRVRLTMAAGRWSAVWNLFKYVLMFCSSARYQSVSFGDDHCRRNAPNSFISPNLRTHRTASSNRFGVSCGYKSGKLYFSARYRLPISSENAFFPVDSITYSKNRRHSFFTWRIRDLLYLSRSISMSRVSMSSVSVLLLSMCLTLLANSMVDSDHLYTRLWKEIRTWNKTKRTFRRWLYIMGRFSFEMLWKAFHNISKSTLAISAHRQYFKIHSTALYIFNRVNVVAFAFAGNNVAVGQFKSRYGA